ncbi:MAG: 5-methyltetrahydropteroyltriglutamate--homocysteine S-methyltransferase [Limosilactobacillus sp.]|jgi:methionine synthase II (cobalamin-independent)|uniref:5-methyltetrahydropteroyltriglutamate-- homocysteine S-methyltransferase n=1 Tax=Limosilactobacillus sp. TaxID=2773925 RepID=UPI0025B7D74C|nr:5-methyltetrahydropteroyltriglutamate--homocysteine S-methyltransferase [Limosilactobacillus sp.]MCI1975433.1 5-methyltetrahydropteroyltriglutamate--homocysteine S-methyltransferase [Limosilactobacillus sp.]MCI2030364.1 5-methyltetrahydropteroyltriglutamate--homocysteine S-methyltransferase [Limosilactobacillus sp.]
MTQFTTRTTSPFRYDIVGSFLRPQALKEARAKFTQGQISRDDLTKVEDKCIIDLVNKEEAVGLHAVTDGEFRRSYWHLDTFWGFAGIKHTTQAHGYLFHDEETRNDSAQVSGKIAFKPEHPDVEAFKFLKKITKDKDVIPRQSIPAPAQFYAELVRGDENIAALRKYYPTDDELFHDIAKAYHDLILALYDAGCRDVKIDDCTWGMVVDDDFWATMAKAGFDRESLENTYLKLNNDAIADLPDDLTVNTHICRGNYHSTWAAKGGYGPVADHLFAHENVHAFYLEYDSERAGGFEPLAKVPDDKYVVLGLVTSKSGKLEDPQTIIDRINEAAKYHPLDHLCLSTQCGFASTEEGNILTEDQQWAKIKLVKQIAEQVWG